MGTFHRAVTRDGGTVVVTSYSAGSYYQSTDTGEMQVSAEELMWVDPQPLDLQPAQYADTKLVQLGDKCCAGGEEFTVESIEPAYGSYLFGRVRGERTWYACEYVVLLARKGS